VQHAGQPDAAGAGAVLTLPLVAGSVDNPPFRKRVMSDN
jgi:hypothetical protein